MNLSIFLSHSAPWCEEQRSFIGELRALLLAEGLEPRTLGVSDYDMSTPLKGIRRLMNECNGLITVAFRRALVSEGKRMQADGSADPLNKLWLTSPFCHIEPAMAFQIGLPILILREDGVVADGVLEKGVVGLYMPQFSLAPAGGSSTGYLRSGEFMAMLRQWEAQVRTVVATKAEPPKLY